MDSGVVRFLDKHGIRQVVSLNEFCLTQSEKDDLADSGIAYKHVGMTVAELFTPTLMQLVAVDIAYSNVGTGATLVYCGDGHGRTGTAITALQMFGGRLDMSRDDYKENNVETEAQMKVLDEILACACS